MTKTLAALLVVSFASSAFAGERINEMKERVPTYKAQANEHAKDHFTIHTQVKYKSGALGEVQVHSDYSRPIKYEELAHAENAQLDLMKRLEKTKIEHNEEYFQQQHRQIEEIATWIERTTTKWTTTERVPE